MAVHESSVNFQNLIRDLAEMYPFDVTEIVVVELIANSLDAKASRILINFDPRNKVLVIEDNGTGMNRSQFDEYHDFAAGLKVRGSGIGFAGLGAKISFNIADRVITETRSKSLARGSNWYLHSKTKLCWEDIKSTHIRKRGTRVEVQFRSDTKVPFETTTELIKVLYRHYLPLFDTKFLELYESMNLYAKHFRFAVNNHIVEPKRVTEELSLDKVKEFFPKRKTKKFGYGVFGISEHEYPVAPDVCGVFLCTYGKVIKIELFNQFPGDLGPRIFGMVEVPEFVKYLTTSKTDFVRRGKHKEFENLYGPIRQEFKEWLNSIGVESAEVVDTNEAVELEREIKRLSEDIPELGEFFGFWSKKQILRENKAGTISSSTTEGSEITYPLGEGAGGEGQGPVDLGDGPGQATSMDSRGNEKAQPISRKSRRGPKIAFVDAPDRLDLAWVEGNNVVINSGHASYIKCRSNTKARRIHSLFAIASAIQRFLGGEAEKPDLLFIDRMMMAWGQR